MALTRYAKSCVSAWLGAFNVSHSQVKSASNGLSLVSMRFVFVKMATTKPKYTGDYVSVAKGHPKKNG
ncbi:MAG: hypothetical protein CM15mV122_080 [uncultured marine virus]|nr:MAG: hypothetical protein CM15mV122_080 [uncultured marine virus]